MTQTIYQRNGFADRKEYLESIACDFGIHMDTVSAIADLLGPAEDFDGLISSLDDVAYYAEGRL